MRRLFLLAITFALMSLSGLFVTQTAFAYNIFTNGGAVDCSNGSTASSSAVCAGSGTNKNPVSSDLAGITNIVAIVAGIAAVILLIVGGIRYIVSDGDSTKITNAKNTIIYALIGLVVIVAARVLITYVVEKL